MREGLRSTTVSQRRKESRRRRNQSESRRAVKPVSDVGLAGDSSRVKNLLPDLNSEANPTEFDPDWLCDGEYAGVDGSESKGTLVENGVEEFAVDDSRELKGGLDTEGKGEGGKDPMNACLVRMEHCEQEGNVVLRNSGANMIDINAEVLESDELDCNTLYANDMVLEKDKTVAVDVNLEPETVSNHGCDADTAPILEDNELNETKMEVSSRDCSADLQSRAVVLECVSENVTSSMDSLGGRQGTIGEKKIVPEIEKLQFGGKVLRSRVVSTPKEGQLSGYSRRKRATDCQVNETEVTESDEINENLKGSNKKHKISSERPGEMEIIDLRSLLHGEEAVAEGLKNDEGNGFAVGQNKTDNECWETSGRKDENSDSLNDMIVMDDTASEVVNNDISKEPGVGLGLDPNQSRKVGRGRGRSRKQYNDNVSVNLLHESIEGSLEDSVMLKQEENNRLADGTNKQQEGTLGGLKKRKRGRPRKIDKENGPEETDNAGTWMKKLGSHKIVKGTKRNLRGKNRKNNSLNLMLQNDEVAPTDEIKLMKDGDNEGAGTTNKWNKFRQGRLKKRKRGRPRKINKENDVQERIPPDQEGIDKVKVKTRASGTVSPSFDSKLKRKGENIGEEPSKSESQLSSKCSVKVKSSSSTREEKQMVRQQIVDMLINAGWTVEYKPRLGKVYSDAVYRSPQGRTHWSVTLAYRVLKRQVETGKTTNFIFTPIPEEKLSTLFRVQVRTRSDKNQPRTSSSGVKSKGRKKGGYNSDGEEKTAGSLFKRKPSSGKKQNKRRCALLVRSGHGPSSAAEYMSVSGKHSILSWMIECGVISPGGKVQYRRRTKLLLEGSITRDGIHCSCCSQLHSVAQFEAHAGLKSCQMYENLYLDNGSSFLHCQWELWNKQEESIRFGFHNVNVDNNDPNDDTCGICGDGGQLVCCDGCPSTFHSSCLNIEKFPSGDWHCVYCSCKYCGTAGCDVDEDNDEHNKSPSLLTCCLCDGKYHQFCTKDGVHGLSSGSAFCGKSCEQIHKRLQQLIGVPVEVEDGYTCTLIKRHDSGPSPVPLEPKEIENVSKLAIALSVMDECFLPIIDHRSGINLMSHTLYSCGSNIERLNFRGFFTAILEKEDEIIAAASIRIRGKELAEMPFIGTRNAYRRQGMCRRLLSGLESALRSLSIEKLVIPAVSEVTETWTSVFGFEPLQELSCEMIHMNLLVFPGVDMLQKPLLRQRFVGATAFNRVGKDVKLGDSQSKKHAEENELFETQAEEGCLSEKFEPSIEALPEVEMSSEDGSNIPLKSAVIDREEGSKSEKDGFDTVHNTQENSPLDHISRFVEGGTGDTAVEGRGNNVASKAEACGDHNLVDLNIQPDSSIDCPKLDLELINPLEKVGADLSATSLCNGDLPSGVSCVNVNGNPVEEINDSLCSEGPASSQTSPGLVNIKFKEVNGQSSEHEENLSLMGHSISNDAQITAKTPGYFKSDLQIDRNIVTPFNLETSCNMGSGSNDLGTPVSFHACSAPEVGSK